MIDIEVQRPKHGRTIKIYGRNDADDQPPVTATVRMEDVHVYSHADMSHEDWTMFSDSVKNAINEMKRRNSPTPLVESSPLSGGDWPKAIRP